MVAFVKETFGDDDRIRFLLGIGIHGCGILIAVEVDGLRLLGEHHRHVAEMPRRYAGDADARRLNGQNLVDWLTPEVLGPSRAHAVIQRNIALLVKKRIHFKHIAHPDDALGFDTLFEFLHESP